jgi:hypothetical protein
MPDVKTRGKPCAGKPHARFDEGGQARACSPLYPRIFDPTNFSMSLIEWKINLSAHIHLDRP